MSLALLNYQVDPQNLTTYYSLGLNILTTYYLFGPYV